MTNFVKHTQIHTKLLPIVRYAQAPIYFTTHTYIRMLFGFQLSLYIIIVHTHNRQQGANKSKKALQTEKEIKRMGKMEVERKTTGWAARDPSGLLSPYTYTLRLVFSCFDL